MSSLAFTRPLARALATTSTSSWRTTAGRPIAASIAGPSRYTTPRIENLPSLRYNSTVPPPPTAAAAASNTDAEPSPNSHPALEAPQPGSKPSAQIKVEPRLSLTFTCTANDCGHRSTHEFAKKSYEKGIVLVQCPSCKNRHLIADHLGWFKESTEAGTLKTVEDLLRAKGEVIKKGRVNFDGDIEYDGES